MKTRRDIISDVELRLTKFKPSDDLELEYGLMGQWVDLVRDEIAIKIAEQAIANNIEIDYIYVDELEGVTIIPETEKHVLGQRRWVMRFPESLLDGRKKFIVYRVRDSKNRTLIPITEDEREVYDHLWFSGASSCNPMYFREEDYLVMKGADEKYARDNKFNVLYVETKAGEIDDDVPYPIGYEHLPMLLDRVEEIGTRALMKMQDRINDGNDEQQQQQQ